MRNEKSKREPNPDSDLMYLPELAIKWDRDIRTIHRQIAEGRLPFNVVRLSEGKRAILRSDYVAWLASVKAASSQSEDKYEPVRIEENR